MARYKTVHLGMTGYSIDRPYSEASHAKANYNTLRQQPDTLFVALLKGTHDPMSGWADSVEWTVVYKYAKPKCATGVL